MRNSSNSKSGMMTYNFNVKILIHYNTPFLSPMSIQFYQEILPWFNTLNNTHISLSVDQILLQNYPPHAVSDNLRRRLDLLILLTKRYIYRCKINEKNLNNLQFINKIKMQWKIENLIQGSQIQILSTNLFVYPFFFSCFIKFIELVFHLVISNQVI